MVTLNSVTSDIEGQKFTSKHMFQVYLDTVGDPDKYRNKLSERFHAIKFVVSKKADSLYPVVSGASIVAKVIS